MLPVPCFGNAALLGSPSVQGLCNVQALSHTATTFRCCKSVDDAKLQQSKHNENRLNTTKHATSVNHTQHSKKVWHHLYASKALLRIASLICGKRGGG